MKYLISENDYSKSLIFDMCMYVSITDKSRNRANLKSMFVISAFFHHMGKSLTHEHLNILYLILQYSIYNTQIFI